MNLQAIKARIDASLRVPTTANVMWAEVQAFLDNPENKLTDKRKTAGAQYFRKALEKRLKATERAEKASAKAREKIIKEQKAQAARVAKLREENPYFVLENGEERVVELAVSASYGRRFGRFQGKASIQIPVAKQWAIYCAKSHKTTVSIVNFRDDEKPVISQVNEMGVEI